MPERSQQIPPASESSSPPSAPPPSAVRGGRLIDHFDAWMALHPWHPRLVPFAVYGVFLLLISLGRDAWPASYPLLYAMQCAAVVWLLWRYRGLLGELNWRWHWIALPAGVGVFYAWLWLGMAVAKWDLFREQGPWTFTRELTVWMIRPYAAAPYLDSEATNFVADLGPRLGWPTMVLRLAGMALVVPMFEELFVRSLILRSLSHPRRTAIGMFQLLHDLPLVGDWLVHTDLARRAHRHPPVFGPEFHANPLGRLTLFGVAASTVVFAFSHLPRDWPGAVVCGVVYCGVVWASNRPGSDPARHKDLGPVIWAHAITNAMLWAYTLHTGDWQFL